MSEDSRKLTEGEVRLAALKIADLTTIVQIKAYLARNPKVSALVSAQGDCYVAGDDYPRQKQYLVGLVKTHIGTPTLIPVSPLALERWKKDHQTKTGTSQIKQQSQVNNKLKYVIGQAVAAGASDIYLDIGRVKSIFSFRVFGAKQLFEELDREDGLALARSMWAMTDTGQFADTAPCDCAFSMKFSGTEWRVRGNSIPDVRGASVVLRLRDPSFILPLDQCGYSPEQTEMLERMCNAPGGLIVISGETNSGKSTTLASIMKSLPATQKIIEIADPVEVHMDHVTHVELNHYKNNAEAGFDQIQAALVRQNPDTLILGEIRDKVTAAAAVRMAIQGKRVYSTLHSQSCLAAIPRLENLGVGRELLGLREFMVGIVSQNLVPVPCSSCALDKHPNSKLETHYKDLFGAGLKHLNQEGCKDCTGGIAGQTLVAEVYPFVLDRTGIAYELITNRNLPALEKHMRQTMKVQTKHQHATSKIRTGQIPPAETAQIIGEFHKVDVPHQKINVLPLRRVQKQEAIGLGG